MRTMELLTIPGLDNSQRLRQMREESRKRMMSESRQKQAMMALLAVAGKTKKKV